MSKWLDSTIIWFLLTMILLLWGLLISVDGVIKFQIPYNPPPMEDYGFTPTVPEHYGNPFEGGVLSPNKKITKRTPK